MYCQGEEATTESIHPAAVGGMMPGEILDEKVRISRVRDG